MKKLLAITLLFLTSACGDDIPLLPVGYELVSSDGNFHFVYISQEFIDNKTSQREVGRIICEDIFKTPEYCEVWYWTNKEEIPKGFPVINRKSIIGLYQMKGEKIKLKALTGNEADTAGADKSKREVGGEAITNFYKNKGSNGENSDESSSESTDTETDSETNTENNSDTNQ